ncbi:hypothetical protein CGCFRS4_v015917 [Colletotrichum fructicola]|nr:hypothetical protein CGCFRS4_v015917 [Colletotrichum fructicola]
MASPSYQDIILSFFEENNNRPSSNTDIYSWFYQNLPDKVKEVGNGFKTSVRSALKSSRGAFTQDEAGLWKVEPAF